MISWLEKVTNKKCFDELCKNIKLLTTNKKKSKIKHYDHFDKYEVLRL